MRSKNLFWGGILVTLGTLFILRNTGIVYFNWYSLIRLWPIMLVFFGITLLPIRNGVKLILSLFTIVALFAVLLTGNTDWDRETDYNWSINKRFESKDSNNYESDIANQYFYELYSENLKEATIKIEAIAGDFNLREESDYLFEFTQDGNIGPYMLSSNDSERHRIIRFKLRDDIRNFRRLVNDVELKLNKEPIWNFDIETGAAKLRLDLRKFKAQEVSISGGASSVNLKLGDLFPKINVYIQSGASSITLSIPEESGCEINTTTFLSSHNFDGFDKIDKGYYQTPNYDDAKNKIRIDIDAAITSLKVRRY